MGISLCVCADKSLNLQSTDDPACGQTINAPEMEMAVIGMNVTKVNHHQASILYNRLTRARK